MTNDQRKASDELIRRVLEGFVFTAPTASLSKEYIKHVMSDEWKPKPVFIYEKKESDGAV